MTNGDVFIFFSAIVISLFLIWLIVLSVELLFIWFDDRRTKRKQR
jgi:hypothetical protein